MLAALAAAVASPALAQTEKGAKYLGLGLGDLTYQRIEKNNSFLSAALFPAVGVFVVDNLLAGANLELGYERRHFSNQFGDARYRRTSFGVTPFLRYYLLRGERHKLFGQASAGYTWARIDNAGYVENYTPRYMTAGAAVGYNYFLTPTAALEATAGYTHRDNGPAPATNGLDIRAGFAIFLPSKASN